MACIKLSTKYDDNLMKSRAIVKLSIQRNCACLKKYVIVFGNCNCRSLIGLLAPPPSGQCVRVLISTCVNMHMGLYSSGDCERAELGGGAARGTFSSSRTKGRDEMHKRMNPKAVSGEVAFFVLLGAPLFVGGSKAG